ncbi:MAG: pantetheine-phosphate adenylyltransferase [candidate division FCPU426 bacterium]
MKKKALYPGSFDPLTLGHLDLIKRGLSLFDEVMVGVVANPGKNPMFSIEERIAMIQSATRGLKGVTIKSFDGLLIDRVKQLGNPVVLRGLRVLSDFEYEFQMALMNRKLYKPFEVVYLMPDERYTYISSSLVKEVARLGGKVEDLVPPGVAKAVAKKTA